MKTMAMTFRVMLNAASGSSPVHPAIKPTMANDPDSAV